MSSHSRMCVPENGLDLGWPLTCIFRITTDQFLTIKNSGNRIDMNIFSSIIPEVSVGLPESAGSR